MKRLAKIKRFCSALLLLVFSIAITPWGVLHAHERPVVAATDAHCLHKQHITVEQEVCLVCKAHIEKNFALIANNFSLLLPGTITIAPVPATHNSTTQIITAALRGPPLHA